MPLLLFTVLFLGDVAADCSVLYDDVTKLFFKFFKFFFKNKHFQNLPQNLYKLYIKTKLLFLSFFTQYLSQRQDFSLKSALSDDLKCPNSY